jgi:sugar phosphate isomerase/epimerase
MSISRTSLNAIPLSFASVSVGTPGDPLEEKLKAISSAGFHAIELGFPDLLSFAHSFHEKEIREDDYGNLCVAGSEVKKLCERYGLEIMMLQPFSNFEGWEKGSREREDAFARARGWIRIMRAVGTDMLQVIYFLFSSHLSSSESRSNRSDRSAHQILLISALTSMSLLRI